MNVGYNKYMIVKFMIPDFVVTNIKNIYKTTTVVIRNNYDVRKVKRVMKKQQTVIVEIILSNIVLESFDYPFFQVLQR